MGRREEGKWGEGGDGCQLFYNSNRETLTHSTCSKFPHHVPESKRKVGVFDIWSQANTECLKPCTDICDQADTKPSRLAMWVSHSHKDTGQVTALHTVHGTSTLETSQLDVCCTMQAVPSILLLRPAWWMKDLSCFSVPCPWLWFNRKQHSQCEPFKLLTPTYLQNSSTFHTRNKLYWSFPLHSCHATNYPTLPWWWYSWR